MSTSLCIGLTEHGPCACMVENITCSPPNNALDPKLSLCASNISVTRYMTLTNHMCFGSGHPISIGIDGSMPPFLSVSDHKQYVDEHTLALGSEGGIWEALGRHRTTLDEY